MNPGSPSFPEKSANFGNHGNQKCAWRTVGPTQNAVSWALIGYVLAARVLWVLQATLRGLGVLRLSTRVDLISPPRRMAE